MIFVLEVIVLKMTTKMMRTTKARAGKTSGPWCRLFNPKFQKKADRDMIFVLEVEILTTLPMMMTTKARAGDNKDKR